MKQKNFERELPDGYRLALVVDAKNAKFGLIFNIIAFLVLVVVMIAAYFLLKVRQDVSESWLTENYFAATLIFMAVIVVYLVLHELVHGLAYKALTGEKLTFGLSWSCAYCGVPNIFTYRRVSLIAVAAPFVFFTVIFIPILAMLYYLSPLYFMLSAAIFGLHLGGCSGDIYIMCLLLFKYKGAETLMNDTGPKMSLYVKE